MKLTLILGLALSSDMARASVLPLQPPRTVEQIKHRNKNEDPHHNIVGGKPADPFVYTDWLVAIQRRNYQFCAGSLFGKNLMVTAAHCSILGIPYKELRVSARRHCLNREEEPALDMTVEEIIVHPDFDYGSLNNDVAVWRLKGGDSLKTVRLDNGPNSGPGRNSTVIGWGATSETGDASDCLLEVSVPVVDQPTCKNALGPRISDSMLCAGGKKGEDACQGDSGGPMVVLRGEKQPVLTGVVSWGRGCARAGLPGVYTRVSRFRAWLRGFLSTEEQILLDLDAEEQAREVDEEQTKPNDLQQKVEKENDDDDDDDDDADDDDENDKQEKDDDDKEQEQKQRRPKLRFQRKD